MASETKHTVGAARPTRSGFAFTWRDGLLLAALLTIAALIAVLLIHPRARPSALGAATAPPRGPYEGLTLSPRPEPPLVLRNYLGNVVDIKSFRGKAVLVTFLYTHCPQACPLIASNLHAALAEMKPTERREVQIIAVSVDPRGDTPASVAAFLRDHGMTGRMDYLIGDARRLSATWAAWGIGARTDAGDPALVAHSALIYGVTGRGEVMTVYQDTGSPSIIVHDVPRLRASAVEPAA